MGLKNRFVLSLIAICIVLVMLSGIAAAANASVTLTNGDKTYSLANVGNDPNSYLTLSGTMSGSVIINSNLNIILNGVNITQNNDSRNGAFVINGPYTVNIYLADGSVNTITGQNGTSAQVANIEGAGKAGIYVPENSHLTIDAISLGGGPAVGSGQLTAQGGVGRVSLLGSRVSGSGAGIGGRGGFDDDNSRDGTTVGSITILNGVITAIGGAGANSNVSPGRDIGGGSGAYRQSSGPGGHGGSVGLIDIQGGVVNAVTHGIGGGHGGKYNGNTNGGGKGGTATILISGGTVHAKASTNPAIGGGRGGDNGPSFSNSATNLNNGYGGEVTITINGDATVYAPTDTSIAAGINGGNGPNQNPAVNSNITLSNGNVFYEDHIYFHANGGIYSNAAYSYYYVNVSSPKTLGSVFNSANPAFGTVTLSGPDGATFAGWVSASNVQPGVNYFITNNLPSALNSGSTLPKNTTYYAIWTYNITLDPNDGVSTPVAVTVQKGFDWNAINTLITGAGTPNYAGWNFGGWWSAASGGVIDKNSAIPWTGRNLGTNPIVGSETFYALWEGSVTLNPNGETLWTGVDPTKTIHIQPGMTYTDITALIDNVVTLPAAGGWTPGWYTMNTSVSVPGSSAKFVELATKFISNNLIPGDILYFAWTTEITLDANDGTFSDGDDLTIDPDTIVYGEVQKGQTFDAADFSAFETAVYTDSRWTAGYWYKSVAGNIVSTPWVNGTLFEADDVLYVGWFDDIILDANGGTFGASGNPTETVSIQAANTFTEINGLIATALTSKAPVYGSWTSDMWYTAVTGGLVSSTDKWDASSAPVAALYVGWFGQATFNASPGVFLENAGLQIGPGTDEYIIAGIQPGQNVLGLIPAADLSGHRLMGWLFANSTPWSSVFGSNGQTVSADWRSNTGTGTGGGTRYGEATISDATSSGKLVEDGNGSGIIPKEEIKDVDPQPPVTPEKKSNTIWYILLLILLLLLICGTYYYFKTRK